MYIKEIEINNFRIYKDSNVIQILPEDDKNIVVISGKNGFGKTTFLMSLVWCLYGKQMEQVDELYSKEIKEKKNYTNYISSCLNRLAAEEGKTQFSVSITFVDVRIPEITCSEVKITRSYDVMTSTIDKLEILIDGYHNEVIDDLSNDNQNSEEIFIRDFILPIEIAKFFLFDAEKIVSLAEVDSLAQRKHLSKAYSEVLGIQKYEDLKSTLEEKQDEYRKKSAKPEEREELNRLKTDIENAEYRIKVYEKEMEENEDQNNFHKKEIDEIQHKLIREGEKMSIDELEKLKTEKKGFEDKRNILQEQLRELFDLIPFGLAGESMMNISEQLRSEKHMHDRNYQVEELREKINKILRDIEVERTNQKLVFDCDIRNFYEDQIRLLVKKHFFSDIPETTFDVKVLHEFPVNQINEFNQLLDTLKHSFKDTFSKINTEYAFIKNQMESIGRRIRDAEKNAEDEYIGELRRRKSRLESELEKIQKENGQINQQIGAKINEIKTYRQRQEILRQKIDVSSEYSEKEKKTKELINKLQTFITQFKEQKKKSLEAKMLRGLTILLHKKNFIAKVEVDISMVGDDIDIILYDPRGKIIDKGSLSMGERQMYASALLHALVDESDIEFPVFIDSPMQKFDEQHARNIIRYFYPSVSKQVVIFPLINKELTAKEFEELIDKVCKSFIITNHSIDSSRFQEVDPSKFLSTYNELYNAN